MTTSRRRYHHGDLPASVLRAASNILEKQGVDGLTVRAVARRARVSHNAPYRHFADREALLAALAADGYGLLGRQQREAAPRGLRAMGEAYVDFALEHPQLFRLMFAGRLPLSRYPALRASAMQTTEGLAGALAARLPGSHGAGDASIAAWALVHGLTLLLLQDRLALNGRTRKAFVREVLATARFAAVAGQPA
jgi:AcrR family transcriptional regulator